MKDRSFWSLFGARPGGGGWGWGSENFGSVTKNVPNRPIMYCSILMISYPPPSLAYKFLKPYDPAKSSDRPPSDDKFRQVPNWLLSAAFN